MIELDPGRVFTEEEAAGKWCPSDRELAQHPFTANGTPDHCCIGSKCMAWRWSEKGKTETANGAIGSKDPAVHLPPPGGGWERHGDLSPTGVGSWFQTWVRVIAKPKGYCGLAGHP